MQNESDFSRTMIVLIRKISNMAASIFFDSQTSVRCSSERNPSRSRSLGDQHTRMQPRDYWESCLFERFRICAPSPSTLMMALRCICRNIQIKSYTLVYAHLRCLFSAVWKQILKSKLARSWFIHTITRNELWRKLDPSAFLPKQVWNANDTGVSPSLARGPRYHCGHGKG